jgi:hypothetical protein
MYRVFFLHTPWGEGAGYSPGLAKNNQMVTMLCVITIRCRIISLLHHVDPASTHLVGGLLQSLLVIDKVAGSNGWAIGAGVEMMVVEQRAMRCSVCRFSPMDRKNP